MKLRLHGPLDRVTGSCYELVDDALDVHFLVDCGMRQGEPEALAYNAGPLPFDPALLDFVVLTHAHIDHCGLLPRLVKEGFTGPVLCTRETQAIAMISLLDAAKQRGATFDAMDVQQIDFREPPGAVFDGWYSPHPKVNLRFTRAGHIAGAISPTVTWGERPGPGEDGRARSIAFSGDIGEATDGQEHHPIIASRRSPPLTRYAVVESTYGGTVRPDEHRSMHARIERLHVALQRALASERGIVLIPCFAVGRTQDLLFDVHAVFAMHPADYEGVEVILDAPMGARVNRVYADLVERRLHGRDQDGELAWLGAQSVAFFSEGGRGGRRRPREDEDRAQWQAIDCLREMLVPGHRRRVRGGGIAVKWRRLWRPAGKPREVPVGRTIVITGAGMCDGGPIQFYLRELARDPDTTVLFNGWVHPQSVGGKLMKLADLAAVPGLPPPPPPVPRSELTDLVRLSDVEVPLSSLRLKVDRLYGYSAHADQRGLVEWLFPLTERVVGEARRPAPSPNAPLGELAVREVSWATDVDGDVPLRGEQVPLAQQVFITHGEPEPRQALAAAVQAQALRLGREVVTHLPSDESAWFDLDEGRWVQ